MTLHGSLSYFDFPLPPALGAYTVLSLYLSGEMIKVVVVLSSHFYLNKWPGKSYGT